MHRNLLVTVFLSGAIASSTLYGNDIPPEYEYMVAKPLAGGQEIQIDGDLSEWPQENVIENPPFYIPKGAGDTGTLVTFEEYNGGTWENAADQSNYLEVVYDTENVYVSVLVIDDYHENAANSPWNGDSVQIMLANGDRDAQFALYNYAIGGVDGNLGEDTIIMHEAGPGGTEAVVARDTASLLTTYEIKIPADALGNFGGELSPGLSFGLGMAINDGDELTPGQKGWGGLGAHALVFSKTPAETALVFLDDYPVVQDECDFDGDTDCDVDDLDGLTNEIGIRGKGAAAGPAPSPFDLTGDGNVDDADRDAWLSQAATKNGLSAPYQLGDSNLDLKVDAEDLNAVGINWQTDNHLWSGGNFTRGSVNAEDLNLVGINWQQTHPDFVAGAQGVPEPAGCILALGALLLLIRRRR